ncbi:shikimate kinase [bacterium]|nr:shikimate kinase [bacterium]
MKQRTNIVLVGMMGSGKSSVAKHLTTSIKWPLIDMDEEIEQYEKQTITSLFETKGEAYFRKLETAFLTRLLESKEIDNNIISTGGGIVEKQENYDLLSQLGCVVYLKAKSETLYLRISDDTTRPLLSKTNDSESMHSKLESLLVRREKKYEMVSNIVLNTDDKTILQISNEIELLLTTTD